MKVAAGRSSRSVFVSCLFRDVASIIDEGLYRVAEVVAGGPKSDVAVGLRLVQTLEDLGNRKGRQREMFGETLQPLAYSE